MYLKFYVKNQTLTRKNRPITASGSKNYLFAEFRFSAEWAGVTKTAVFVSPDRSMRYHMLIENGRCAVPAELIKEGGFYVSVFGGNRITSTSVFVDVSASGIETGLTPPEPTKDVYDAIIGKIDGVYEALENVSLKCPDNYITASMISAGAVTTGKIADNAVTSKKLADGAVMQDKLAAGAVTSEKIVTGAVTKSKIADGAVTENTLDSFVKARLDKTDTVENKVFSISSAEYALECVLPSELPALRLEGDDVSEGEYITVDMSDLSPVIKVNGEEKSIVCDVYSVRIPTSGASYIRFFYDINEEVLTCSSSAEASATAVKNGVWSFTAYMYDNIRLEFKVSNDDDYFIIESYGAQYSHSNADKSGASYTIAYDYLVTSAVGELSDLKTDNKNSILEAVNENAQNIKDLRTEVSAANAELESVLSEGV